MNVLKFRILSKIFLLAIGIFISFVSFSQDRRPCGTSEMVKEALKKNPDAAKKLADLEYFTQHTPNLKMNTGGVLIIPVVFHIIHQYGNENISKSQVLDAMRIINEDYRKRNADTVNIVPAFQNLAADIQVEFRLAQIDPFGNCTDGITRTVSDLTFAGDESVKDLISWNTTTQKYLQIWVVETIASGAGGYSAYPGVFGTKYEGVIIRSAQTTTDRSITHEIGHYLNLIHTWGNSNNPALPFNCGDDDNVMDTPNTIGHTSCDLNVPSCGSAIDNVQNYMEYSFCCNMFTKGQSARMNAALNFNVGDRNNLWAASNLIATGTNDGYVAQQCKPVVDFAIKNNLICEGSSVTYTDLSWNADTLNYNWTFPGGTPSTSNVKDPVIQYNTAGTYNVVLNVSNTGGSTTLTKTNSIRVLSKSTAIPMNTFSEGFESMTFPNTDWLLNNADASKTWSIVTNAGYNSSKSIKMNNFGNTVGAIDEFITPQFDFSNTSRPVLSFRLSGARKTTLENDQLRVLVSTDCGETWKVKYSKKGGLLANAGLYATAFKPGSNSQWRVDSIVNLQLYAGNPSVRFKFEFTSDGGNNIYIDNINLDNATSIQDVELEKFGVALFPNPSEDETTIRFNLHAEKKVALQILDIMGRQVRWIDAKSFPVGEHRLLIKKNELPSGNYIVKLFLNGEPIVRKMILQ